MGTLIAIPASVRLTRLGLTPAGLALARCLQDYGAYLADTGGTEQITLFAEDAAQDMDRIKDLRADFTRLVPYLSAVLNNGPKTVGGGGKPRRPAAPPLPSR
jgi:hypothetical protein